MVTAEVQLQWSKANVSHMLRHLQNLNHVVVMSGLDRPESAAINLDCLSHVERLDLHSVSMDESELLVLLRLAHACSLRCALPCRRGMRDAAACRPNPVARDCAGAFS